MQREKLSYKRTGNAVLYKGRGAGMSKGTITKQKTNKTIIWRSSLTDLTIPEEYFAYSEHFRAMFTQAESIQDRSFGSIKRVQNQIELVTGITDQITRQ